VSKKSFLLKENNFFCINKMNNQTDYSVYETEDSDYVSMNSIINKNRLLTPTVIYQYQNDTLDLQVINSVNSPFRKMYGETRNILYPGEKIENKQKLQQ
jgi:hypothetical protein